MERKRELELVEISADSESLPKPRRGMAEAAFYAVRFLRWNRPRCGVRFPAAREDRGVHPLYKLVLADGSLNDSRPPPIHRKPRKR